MASRLRLLLAAVSLVLAAALPITRGAAGDQYSQLGQLAPAWMLSSTDPLDDLAGDDEFALDSESSRRLLLLAGTGSYISYGALRPGTVPCSIPGQSYYTNCRAGGGPVNPYTRLCSTINKCRS